ncbi:MAG: hypothetical protein LDL41_24405 [Coleofasciculus sp. S288]|nr:hypothetical protein [Coleofasciculus sp. S288]
MDIRYINQGKRGKVGLCNICKQSASLSWDHVPPKGGIDLTPVDQLTILQCLTANSDEQKSRISQNGVKYRTLCKQCNARLGHSYDPLLNEFALGVGRVLKSIVKVPPVIHYRTQPAALIRAILGHLLAAKAFIDNVDVDQKIRDFLFDEQAHLPEDIKIFYWIYPYQEIVVVRDIVMPAIRGNFSKFGFFSGILKYFPIAYLVCNLEKYEGLDELTVYRNIKLEEVAEIPIHLTSIKHPLWPEITNDGNFIVGGLNLEGSIYARPRKT